MKNVKVGETFSGDELWKLCGAKGDDRYVAVVGTKAAVIAVDVGNDNYEIVEVIRRDDVGCFQIRWTGRPEEALEVEARAVMTGGAAVRHVETRDGKIILMLASMPLAMETMGQSGIVSLTYRSSMVPAGVTTERTIWTRQRGALEPDLVKVIVPVARER